MIIHPLRRQRRTIITHPLYRRGREGRRTHTRVLSHLLYWRRRTHIRNPTHLLYWRRRTPARGLSHLPHIPRPYYFRSCSRRLVHRRDGGMGGWGEWPLVGVRPLSYRCGVGSVNVCPFLSPYGLKSLVGVRPPVLPPHIFRHHEWRRGGTIVGLRPSILLLTRLPFRRRLLHSIRILVLNRSRNSFNMSPCTQVVPLLEGSPQHCADKKQPDEQ